MYQDISNIERHLGSIAELLDKIAASQRLIATAAMQWARTDEPQDAPPFDGLTLDMGEAATITEVLTQAGWTHLAEKIERYAKEQR